MVGAACCPHTCVYCKESIINDHYQIEEIDGKLRAIADWLGWSERTRSPIMNKNLPPMFSTPWGITANRASLAFYIEAEIEKRSEASNCLQPLLDISGGTADYVYMRQGSNPALTTYTEVFVCEYASADPHSKINATIEAAWQAAQMCLTLKFNAGRVNHEHTTQHGSVVTPR